MTHRHRSGIRGIFSKIMNFLCALIIMFIVLFAIGAFIEADFQTRSVVGNHTTSLFSYVRHEDNTAELKAFGESITINFNRLGAAHDRLVQISEFNRGYAPSFIILSGAVIRGSLSSVGEWFGRIPYIIAYLVNSPNSPQPLPPPS